MAQSEAMRRVLSLTDKAARVDATVLICGESGGGKERVARRLHDESARCGGPFVAINCGALPEALLESELFGHARGSFTGASADRAAASAAPRSSTMCAPSAAVRLLRRRGAPRALAVLAVLGALTAVALVLFAVAAFT